MLKLSVLKSEIYTPFVYSSSKYGGLMLSRYYTPMLEMGDYYQDLYLFEFTPVKDFVESEYYLLVDKDSLIPYSVVKFKKLNGLLYFIDSNEEFVKDEIKDNKVICKIIASTNKLIPNKLCEKFILDYGNDLRFKSFFNDGRKEKYTIDFNEEYKIVDDICEKVK